MAHRREPRTAPRRNPYRTRRRPCARRQSHGLPRNDLWCLSRIGARQLFYGPINQVLPPGTATRWIEALLKAPGAEDALASLARHTGDPVRDVNAAAFDSVRTRLSSERHLAILEGEDAQDERAMGRIFGESLPSGLKLSLNPPGEGEA